ncbi:MAG: hypothetical protein JW837_08630 [Sedimentisphaerales bacterium]|nr:hypothetical protein [Sedimentisphaerales bacterium]
MAQQKKNIARLVLQAISIFGILLGISCFLCGFAMILPPWKGNMGIFPRLIVSAIAFVLGAFLMYPSYLMLRGKSFTAIKSMPALPALTFFGLLMPYAENLTEYFNSEMPIEIKVFVDLIPFLLIVLVSVLIYKISVKLIDKLVKAAYGINNT